MFPQESRKSQSFLLSSQVEWGTGKCSGLSEPAGQGRDSISSPALPWHWAYPHPPRNIPSFQAASAEFPIFTGDLFWQGCKSCYHELTKSPKAVKMSVKWRVFFHLPGIQLFQLGFNLPKDRTKVSLDHRGDVPWALLPPPDPFKISQVQQVPAPQIVMT